MLKKNFAIVVLLMGLSTVVVAAGRRALEPRSSANSERLAFTGPPDILAFPAPLWDFVEQASPFVVGTSLVSLGALLRSRKRRETGDLKD